MAFALGLGVTAAQARGLGDDFVEQGKWKSFGVKASLDFDPFERARAGRPPVQLHELDELHAVYARGKTPVAKLKSLIALAEAGPRGYNAYHMGAGTPPPGKVSSLTLGQIEAWTRATPGQPHAIGRYQFIPATLRSLTKRAGYGPQTRFTPQVQDRLADLLLRDAKIDKFLDGRLSRKAFMNNLARIWAGLPNSSGRSHYDGYAGNRATISWSVYDREIKRIFQ
ncbi:hypothetical protein IV417_15320 [Alphaproteobacteria bacterium KMM 3653]|uniref:Lysozyme n=1 Tax=Harenicola maris TaxID=2841044 RepID=A0AAP2CQP0_9RHOB|nr:hypothetical protein [Harenicola maris]